MRFLPVERDGMALHALGSEHDPERQAESFENGALFNVQFEIGRGVLLVARLRVQLDLDPATAKGVFQPDRLCRRPRSASIDSVPAKAEEPKDCARSAPSSSAQSTSRIVTGGRPPNSAATRRRIASPDMMPSAPSSQPPFGTESRCPPTRSAFPDSPASVTQRLPAASGTMLDHGQAIKFGEVPVARAEPGIGPCDTLRAVSVGSECAQFFEFVDSQRAPRSHGYCGSAAPMLSSSISKTSVAPPGMPGRP